MRYKLFAFSKFYNRPLYFFETMKYNEVNDKLEVGHGNQFSNHGKKWYTVGMDRTTLIDFFEEVETTEEYNGYFCSIAEAVGIVVLGSLCGFRNVR